MCLRLDERLKEVKPRRAVFSGLTPYEVGHVEKYGADKLDAHTIRILYGILMQWKAERDSIAAEIACETARQEWLLYFKEDSDAVDAALSAMRPFYIP